ncbi:hypothetical protein H6P81_016207 [Aristolochia fimbriata]|uniref:Uncharacterized protein n=1 Tax=Aristolochia fimbriata TaxID=158543 RepID=A0AAV7EBF8_ARIFI|nr:hypothetical protein H6P81_016207 [Aristolochia fimbriata]
MEIFSSFSSFPQPSYPWFNFTNMPPKKKQCSKESTTPSTSTRGNTGDTSTRLSRVFDDILNVMKERYVFIYVEGDALVPDKTPKHWEVGVHATENGRLILHGIRNSQMNIATDFFGRSIMILLWESFSGVYTILLEIFLEGLYGSFFGSLNNPMWKVYMNISIDFFLPGEKIVGSDLRNICSEDALDVLLEARTTRLLQMGRDRLMQTVVLIK